MGGLVVVLLPFQRCFQSEGRAGQGRRKQREQRGSKEAVLGASEYWLAQGRGRGGHDALSVAAASRVATSWLCDGGPCGRSVRCRTWDERRRG